MQSLWRSQSENGVIRIKLETDGPAILLNSWNYNLRPSPTIVGDVMSNSAYVRCEGPNHSTKKGKSYIYKNLPLKGVGTFMLLQQLQNNMNHILTHFTSTNLSET